ncbi:hypothetical protein, partial [Marinobacter halodurans]|uniref:hypothetical protein n=1 Tax=Marinobacter halodurans TaxID=2528979 RepID=UPI001A95546D
LGYDGIKPLINRQSKERFDPFLFDMYQSQKLILVDQSDWLFSHSGMHIPSEEVFIQSYKRAIMEERLLNNSSFGRYCK